MIVDRAQPTDVMAWASAHGSPLPRRVYKTLLAQMVVCEAVALRDEPGGKAVIIAGCCDYPEGVGEVFFFAPPGGLGRRLLKIVRLAQRWLAGLATLWPAGLVCFVRLDNRQGERLAQSLGFAPTDIVLNGKRQWRRT